MSKNKCDVTHDNFIREKNVNQRVDHMSKCRISTVIVATKACAQYNRDKNQDRRLGKTHRM
jgi:hypothetical protein